DVLVQLDLCGCDRTARAGGVEGAGDDEGARTGEGHRAPPEAADTTPVLPAPVRSRPQGLDDVERAILGHLGIEPIPLDDLAVLTGLPLGQLSVRLLDLEARGLLVRRGSAVE